MGEVWRARHLALEKAVAVKILRSDRLLDDELADRFTREARIASRLDHPNCMAVLDFGRDAVDGRHFLAMELLEGRTLRQVLDHEGSLPLRDACAIMSQVLAGLAAAHGHGILHRDIKPSNIILKPVQDDDGQPVVRAKVCDFGLARIADGVDVSGIHHPDPRIVGTPTYMSPEQATGDPLDARSDVYACGVVLFEMLTGQPPFEADSTVSTLMKHCAAPVPAVSSLAGGIPVEADRVVAQALEKAPEKRFQTARGFRAAVLELTRLVGVQPLPRSSSGVDTSYFVRPPPSRRPSAPRAGIGPKLPASGSTGGFESGPDTPVVRAEGPAEPPPRSISEVELPISVDVSDLFAEPEDDNETLSLRIEAPDFDEPEILPPMRSFDEVDERLSIDETTRFLYERYALSPHRRPPAKGFWLVDAEGNRIGPLTFDELAVALRLEAHDGGLDQCYVSADPNPRSYRPARDLLALLEADGIARVSPPTAHGEPGASSGRVEPTTVAALLLRATWSGLTGRIIVAEPRSGQASYFEAHFVQGLATHVFTNRLSLQVPSVLVARGAVDEASLPVVANDAWAHSSTFEASLRGLCGLELSEQLPSVMRKRLRYMLAVADGRWAVDHEMVPRHRLPLDPPVPTILPRLIRDGLPGDALERALAPHLKQPLPSSLVLDGYLDQLGLTSRERTLANELRTAPQLSQALPAHGPGRDVAAATAFVILACAESLAGHVD